jgi:membrane-associated protein
VVNILAGLSKTSPKKFILFDVLGEVLYVLIFSGLGYMFSDQWEMISSIAGDVTSVLVLIIILVILLAVFLLNKQNAHNQE